MTILIALDLSLTAPGWFRRGLDGEVTHGVWRMSGAGIPRMHAICRNVLGLLPAGLLPPEGVLVLIEGFSFGSKGSALYEIGGLGYIVRYALWCRKVKVVEVAPAALKKYATGKGVAPKEIVIREVWKRWGVNATDNNHADAVVLGHIGLALLGEDEPTTAEQRAVIAALRNGSAK